MEYYSIIDKHAKKYASKTSNYDIPQKSGTFQCQPLRTWLKKRF